MHMQDLGFEIDIGDLQAADFRNPKSVAKHQEQEAIVSHRIPGKLRLLNSGQELRDFLGRQVFAGSFVAGS